MSALLSPFGQCAEFLNTTVVQPILAPGMEIAVQYVQKLDENELKEKVGFQHLGRRGVYYMEIVIFVFQIVHW